MMRALIFAYVMLAMAESIEKKAILECKNQPSKIGVQSKLLLEKTNDLIQVFYSEDEQSTEVVVPQVFKAVVGFFDERVVRATLGTVACANVSDQTFVPWRADGEQPLYRWLPVVHRSTSSPSPPPPSNDGIARGRIVSPEDAPSVVIIDAENVPLMCCDLKVTNASFFRVDNQCITADFEAHEECLKKYDITSCPSSMKETCNRLPQSTKQCNCDAIRLNFCPMDCIPPPVTPAPVSYECATKCLTSCSSQFCPGADPSAVTSIVCEETSAFREAQRCDRFFNTDSCEYDVENQMKYEHPPCECYERMFECVARQNCRKQLHGPELEECMKSCPKEICLLQTQSPSLSLPTEAQTTSSDANRAGMSLTFIFFVMSYFY